MRNATLNLGITARPCWIWATDALRSVRAYNFELTDDYLYYDNEADGMRWRVQRNPEGMPRMIWAPDGFVLPEKPVEALFGDIQSWGWYALILDPAWFLQLPIEHDGLAGRCAVCKKAGF
jgi:hypothetical protein